MNDMVGFDSQEPINSSMKKESSGNGMLGQIQQLQKERKKSKDGKITQGLDQLDMPNMRATSNLNQHAIVRKTKQLTQEDTNRWRQGPSGEEHKAEKSGVKSSMVKKVQVTQDDFLFGTQSAL